MQLRGFLPDTRISIQEGPLPYDAALSILDPGWSWPGLCMYGHGCFVPVPALVVQAAAEGEASAGCGGALAALRQAVGAVGAGGCGGC